MTEPTSKTPAGREMDALIAEKVMGWARWTCSDMKFAKAVLFRPEAKLDSWQRADGLPLHEYGAVAVERYSIDIAVAWYVVDKLKLSMVHHENRWYVGRFAEGAYIAFTPESPADEIRSSLTVDGRIEPCGVSEELPHAICLAGLAVMNADDARSKTLGEMAAADVADGSYDRAYTGEE